MAHFRCAKLRKMAASQPQAAAASSTAGVSGPGSSGGPGPQQQPQPPAQLVGPAQSGLLQQQQQDFDPVQRYKMLIPQLKESLQVIGRELREASGIWLSGSKREGKGAFQSGSEQKSVRQEVEWHLGLLMRPKRRSADCPVNGIGTNVGPGNGRNSSGREFKGKTRPWLLKPE